MQTGQHIEASQRFLDDVLMLENSGSHTGAAEMVWGATVQVLEAIGHIRTVNAGGHLSGNGRRRLVESVISDGLHRYNLIRNDLHAHFYRGHLSLPEYADRMRRGREYVTELLAVARSTSGQ